MLSLKRLLKAAFETGPTEDQPAEDQEDRKVAKLDFPEKRTLNSVYYPARKDFPELAKPRGYHAPGYHAHYAVSQQELDLMRQVRESMERDTDGRMVQRIHGWLQRFDQTLGLEPRN